MLITPVCLKMSVRKLRKRFFMHAVCDTILSESNQIRHKKFDKTTKTCVPCSGTKCFHSWFANSLSGIISIHSKVNCIIVCVYSFSHDWLISPEHVKWSFKQVLKSPAPHKAYPAHYKLHIIIHQGIIVCIISTCLSLPIDLDEIFSPSKNSHCYSVNALRLWCIHERLYR